MHDNVERDCGQPNQTSKPKKPWIALIWSHLDSYETQGRKTVSAVAQQWLVRRRKNETNSIRY